MTGDSYAKLYQSLLSSTVWCESHPTRIVWIAMLALADAKGRVNATVPGLASLARVTLEECEHAIERFLAPDKFSRTKDHDGRRIEEIDGGWLLLNYAKYREGRDPEIRRLQNREAAQRHRDRVSQRKPTSASVSQRKPESAQAEAEEEKTKPFPKSKPDLGEFTRFWAVYPRRVAKQPALKAWPKVAAEVDAIVADVERRVAGEWAGADQQFIPYPATYLNARRWLDEEPPKPKFKVVLS